MNLIFDIGNTLAKVAIADKQSIIKLSREKQVTKTIIHSFIRGIEVDKIIISSVKTIEKKFTETLLSIAPVHCLSAHSKLPFINKYATPQTLGADRVAAVAGAISLFPKRNLLVVDFGTAITYEFLNDKGHYLGGAISPGMNTRFKALHHFTDKLPLVKESELEEIIGNTTHKAILSGVKQGIIGEVESYIAYIRQEMKNPLVILTGGDAIFFEKSIKYPIFAEPNLNLIGLNRILNINEQTR